MAWSSATHHATSPDGGTGMLAFQLLCAHFACMPYVMITSPLFTDPAQVGACPVAHQSLLLKVVCCCRLPRAKRLGITSVSCLSELIDICAAELHFLHTALDGAMDVKQINHVEMEATMAVVW